ncbi:DUF6577 family protein [Acidobacteriota bacterium]
MRKNSVKNRIYTYAKRRSYFSMRDLRKFLNQNNIAYTNNNLKQSIYRLKLDDLIYESGRGWYSTIKEEFILIRRPIEKTIEMINSNFPLLEFSCWSTEQLKTFFHHLPSQFVAFIYSDKDFLESLRDFLENNDYNVFLNPQKKEAEKFFHFKDRTVILRPSIAHREPKDNHFARIEKIIVDLYVEAKRIELIDKEEFKRIIENIMSNYRINLSKMLDYAHNRKIRREIENIVCEKFMYTNATI